MIERKERSYDRSFLVARDVEMRLILRRIKEDRANEIYSDLDLRYPKTK